MYRVRAQYCCSGRKGVSECRGMLIILARDARLTSKKNIFNDYPDFFFTLTSVIRSACVHVRISKVLEIFFLIFGRVIRGPKRVFVGERVVWTGE